ncbi:M50 family metallopeptidase [Bacillus cabrialesii]|uniref:M50 family metallopeptidase n=2 Tax=Bacillus TaxID=1386 RepID=UPI003D1AE18A
MITPKRFFAGKHELEYCVDNETYYIFNPKNERMLQANEATLHYLQTYSETTEKVKEIENFLCGKRRNSFNSFKFLNFKIQISENNILLRLSQNKFVQTLFLLSIITFFLTLPSIFKEGYTNLSDIEESFKWYDLIYIYIAQLFIIAVHELGHFIVYKKHVNTSTMRFGIMLRYFFMLAFYTNVNYLRNLPRKSRMQIVIAGIMMQAVIGGIIGVLLLFHPGQVLYYIYVINIFIMFVNIVPFLRLDGYWLFNIIINSEDYMQSLKLYITERKKIRPIEFIFGIINVILIMLVVINGIFVITGYLRSL